MKLITQKDLCDALFGHPYENDPAYSAAMSFVHISGDGKLLIGYWHAPVGEVRLDYGKNIENIYVIQGRMKLVKPDGTEVAAASGDILQCGGDSESVNCVVEEYVKALFIVYPQTEEDLAFVRKIEKENSSLRFQVQ